MICKQHYLIASVVFMMVNLMKNLIKQNLGRNPTNAGLKVSVLYRSHSKNILSTLHVFISILKIYFVNIPKFEHLWENKFVNIYDYYYLSMNVNLSITNKQTTTR